MLLPEFAVIIILINILYSIGALVELVAIRYFKCKWNFDALAPIVKKVVMTISIAFVVLLSLFLIWDA